MSSRREIPKRLGSCTLVHAALSLSLFICMYIWRERWRSWAERELSELTIESDGANRDALAGPPFNEINHNGAEGTTQSIRYAATSRVATKNTTREFTLQLERVSRPRFNRVFTPGCWIVFTTYIRGGDSDPCFTTSFWLSFFFFFFFFLHRNN